MLSYLILHFNRPYFLEINIKLIRKFLRPDIKIIIADDGSNEAVIGKIKKMPIDDIFVSQCHSKNSCCGTLIGAKNLCSGDHIVFSEDDFFYTPSPNVLTDATRKGPPIGDIFIPNVSFKKNVEYDLMEESILILESHQDIKQVQFSRQQSNTSFYAESFIQHNIEWRYLDHKRTKMWYYTNWPYMMRMEDFKKIKMKEVGSIMSIEKNMANEMNFMYGNTKNWVITLKKPHYMHVGYSISMQESMNSLRKKSSNIVQQKIEKNMSNDEFRRYLYEQYCNGNFFIDFEQLLNDGLLKTFESSFDRLKLL